jgi:hypothetical protein
LRESLDARPFRDRVSHAMPGSAVLEERADIRYRDLWGGWSREDTHRYFLAGGGGHDDEFDALWSVAISGNERFDKAIAVRTYAGAGGCITYLVAGRKPGLPTP